MKKINKKTFKYSCAGITIISSIILCQSATAGVSQAEADQLGTKLMPLGGEMAGNADGSIPAWTGGITSDPTYQKGGRRDGIFAGDKPLFSINASNVSQYADSLSEGTKAMIAEYPDTYRVDVYKTVRSAAAPQWVYDNTKLNAVRGSIVEGEAGPMPKGVYGGIPFPIPKSGAEVMWDHHLAWRGPSFDFDFHAYLGTADGQKVAILQAAGKQQEAYYYPGKSVEWFEDPNGNDGWYAKYALVNSGPPIRAGEAVSQWLNIQSGKDTAWVYLTGQRRVRMLPNACCDTPHPAAAGLLSYDEIYAFFGRLDRFDWTLVGKKEMYIPYNDNQFMAPKHDLELLDAHHLKPENVRWEKHRVYVVEANLKPGKRHVSPKSRYYLDEDTKFVIQVDRWDANGQLWKSVYNLPFVAADLPGVTTHTFGYYDLISKAWFVSGIRNELANQYPFMEIRSENIFSPDAMAGDGTR